MKLLCYLLILTFVAVFCAYSPAQVQSRVLPKYHIENTSIKHVKATLTFTAFTPNMSVKEWIIFAPAPPDGIGQGKVVVLETLLNGEQIIAEPCSESAPLHRKVLRLRQPAGGQRQNCVAQITYEFELTSRKLALGAPRKPVLPLSEEEQKQFLAATQNFDYGTPIIKDWLNANHLRRQFGESELALAYRILWYMQQQFRYENYLYEPKASIVCRDGKSECGGLSLLFATALRASNVPARVLYGIFTNGDTHSIVEIYAAGIGWIPVEVASAVSFKDRTVESCIGNTEGTYLTLHVDPNLELDTIHNGKQVWPWLQGMVNWSFGDGKYTGQTVKSSWKFQTISTSAIQPGM